MAEAMEKEEAWLRAALRAAQATATSARDLRGVRWQILELSRQSLAGPSSGGQNRRPSSAALKVIEEIIGQVRPYIEQPDARVHVGHIVRFMRSQGQSDLASRIRRLASVRNAIAHPIDHHSLTTDVSVFVHTLAADDVSGSKEKAKECHVGPRSGSSSSSWPPSSPSVPPPSCGTVAAVKEQAEIIEQKQIVESDSQSDPSSSSLPPSSPPVLPPASGRGRGLPGRPDKVKGKDQVDITIPQEEIFQTLLADGHPAAIRFALDLAKDDRTTKGNGKGKGKGKDKVKETTPSGMVY